MDSIIICQMNNKFRHDKPFTLKSHVSIFWLKLNTECVVIYAATMELTERISFFSQTKILFNGDKLKWHINYN